MCRESLSCDPISLVTLQFNSAAKQLIEWDQPPGPAVAAGEGALATTPSSMAPKQPDGKKNTKKRHSFTSLSMASKASQAAQQRHSMEISPPVLISSSNPAAAARIGELAGLSCSAPSQVRAAVTVQEGVNSSSTDLPVKISHVLVSPPWQRLVLGN